MTKHDRTRGTRQLVRKRSQKAGLPPGTLVHIGDKTGETIRLHVLTYDESRCEERDVASPADIGPLSEPAVTWIDIGGVHKLDVIEALGKQFRLHPLLLEDIVNTDQRPKLDDFPEHTFVVLKMLYPGDRPEEIRVEQVSLVLGTNYLLSFQENGDDVFKVIRERVRTGKGRVRQLGADYLLYSLVDAVVDHYFIALEVIGEKVEALQNRLITDPKPETLQEIHGLKRELLFLRRAVWPMREAMGALERTESPLMKPGTKVFVRDVYDHVIQIIDTIETLREMVTGMLDIYLSSVSIRLNNVMKVLTVITTIFMPLTFIVGIYGMNFEHMPELHWMWGYPLILGLMTMIAGSMLLFFKKRKWL